MNTDYNKRTNPVHAFSGFYPPGGYVARPGAAAKNRNEKRTKGGGYIAWPNKNEDARPSYKLLNNLAVALQSKRA